MKPCGPGVEDRRPPVLVRDRHAAVIEHGQRDAERAEHDELDLARLDLLAQVLGRAADHEPGEEHREQDEEQHPVEPRADAAEDDLAHRDVGERHGAAQAGHRLHARR